jgi:hypothetical protein
MFHGYIVPLEIQEEVVLLRRQFHHLQEASTFKTSKGHLVINNIDKIGDMYYMIYSYGDKNIEL